MGLISSHWKKNFKTKFEAIQASREWNELFVSERKFIPAYTLLYVVEVVSGDWVPSTSGQGGRWEADITKATLAYEPSNCHIYTGCNNIHSYHPLSLWSESSKPLNISYIFLLHTALQKDNFHCYKHSSLTSWDRKRMFDVAQSHVLTETTS